jgi:hypothetical protein
MPRSSSSYITQLPSVPSALLKEEGIQVDRANPNIILQTPFRISALSRFQIYRSTLPFLPGRLFYCTQIPACLWFLTKLKGARTLLSASRKKEFIRSRKGETLFIDARKLGTLIDRVHRQLTDADLEKITAEYLTFVAASGQGGVEAVYADENVWLSQKMMGRFTTSNPHHQLPPQKGLRDSELEESQLFEIFG